MHALVNCKGENFAQVFEECDNCIGIAQEYVRNKPSMSAKEYSTMRKLQLVRDHTLHQPITKAEYNQYRMLK